MGAGVSRSVFSRNPQVLSGAPAFSGTRVPVQTLLDYVRAGDSIDDFLVDFPGVAREQAVQFLSLTAEDTVSPDE